MSLLSQYFTCSRQSLVRRCVCILPSSVCGTARSHRSAPVSRLDTGGSRQGSGGEGEDGGRDAEAAADFNADLSRPGKRDYHDPAVPPDRQRRQSTHRTHPGATGVNTDEQRKTIMTGSICKNHKVTRYIEQNKRIFLEKKKKYLKTIWLLSAFQCVFSFKNN